MRRCANHSRLCLARDHRQRIGNAGEVLVAARTGLLFSECDRLVRSHSVSEVAQPNLQITAWDYDELILRTLETASPSLTKRYEPVFMRLAVVKGSLRLASYQHVPSPS